MYPIRHRLAALLMAGVLAAMNGGSTDAADQAPSGAGLAGILPLVASWTAAATGLPMPHDMPQIVRSSRSEMLALRLGDAPGAHMNARIEALYDTRTGTIHLSEAWTGGTVSEMSVLVHEMVHHLQNAAGMRFACPAAREAAAYAAQARFLELGGLDLETAFEIDPLTLLVRTTCAF